jgi:hypothetical protein
MGDGLNRLVVDTSHLSQKGKIVAQPRGKVVEGLDVLGEAESSVSKPGIEEGPADAGITPHDVGHRGHIRPGPLAHPGQGIGIGDLEREKHVAGMLGQPRRLVSM